MDLIEYTQYSDSDYESFVAMSKKLWPDIESSELVELLAQTTHNDKYHILIAKSGDGLYAGFSMFSIRTDYVEGAEKSPTGYLEGIYVEPEFRKNGVAREFVRTGEQWCKEKGCSQIGSDTWLNDTNSRNFHKQIGFREEEEIVCFLKDIE